MNLDLAASCWRELDGNIVEVSSEWAIDSWHACHIWCVQDSILNSGTMEEFLAKAYGRHPYSTCYQGQQPWEQRVHMATWLTKLAVEPVARPALQQIVAAALILSEGGEDADLGQAFRSRLGAIELPMQGWAVTETETPRNPVGVTDIVVFQARSDYFFLETHLES